MKTLKEIHPKLNQLKPSGEGPVCLCGHEGESKVDLIVLIDSSGSMGRTSAHVSAAAADAIKAAQESCKVDLRTKWLWVDRTMGNADAATLNPFPGVSHNFEASHERYLRSIGFSGPFPQETSSTIGWPEGYNAEEGGDAIQVLSQRFDWRKDACRAIFYISDTNLDAYNYDVDDQEATDNAIASAIANEVSIFAHYVEPHQYGAPQTIVNYTDLCTKTGGKAQIGQRPSEKLYVKLLQEAICEACNGCSKYDLPPAAPCISISWGDSDCDCLETNGTEILHITVCNCYANIGFCDFSIGYILAEDKEGNPVAILPDGSPSVEIIPTGPFCFGDIGPCTDGEPTCITREFVLRTRGAEAGTYSVRLGGICYKINHESHDDQRFDVKLCKD